MSAWHELVSAALVGTGRRPPPTAPLAGVADVAPGVFGEPERALLGAAAVLSGYRRAGRRPGAASGVPPAPAGPDPRPLCSDAAAGLLELLLSGEVPVPGGTDVLVAQWLSGAVGCGCRPPARFLPPLLDLGTRVAAHRRLIVEVGGPRARWLARHHDGWAWVGGMVDVRDAEDAARRFTAGSRTERAELLAQVRAVDPAGGRRLLEGTWARDPAAERAALLATLATGLSEDDEPFLEAALDDRAAAVRAGAAALLGRLPASRRAARMAERLRPLVTGGGGRRASLAVTWPDEPDAAARRDGVNDAAPQGTGVRAWRLVQLVAGTPLSFWTGHLGLDPPGVVRLAADTSTESLAGLEHAVAAQGPAADPQWAETLFDVRPSPAVLAAMEPARAAATLTRFLAGTPAASVAVPVLLAAVPGPWPPALSEAVVDRYVHLGGRAAAEISAALVTLAERLDVAALPLVETWADALAGYDAFRRRVRSLAHALSLRLAIHQELR